MTPAVSISIAQCVDEWLKVNASCPTCRESILGAAAPLDEESGAPPPPMASSSSSSSSSSRRVLLSQEEEEDRHDDDHNYNNVDIESVPLCP